MRTSAPSVSCTPDEEFANLVHTHSPGLLAYLRRTVKNAEEAEDVLQDVFTQLILTQRSETPVGRISAWLYRVARNSALNLLRRPGTTSLQSFFTDDSEACEDLEGILFNNSTPAPEREFMRSMVWEELDAALAELPPEQAQVFCLSAIDGIPINDIAKATGVKPATLISRKHYAVMHLRKRLRHLYIDFFS